MLAISCYPGWPAGKESPCVGHKAIMQSKCQSCSNQLLYINSSDQRTTIQNDIVVYPVLSWYVHQNEQDVYYPYIISSLVCNCNLR